MRVKWSERARRQRDEVANYIRREFGAKRKYKFHIVGFWDTRREPTDEAAQTE